MSQGLEQMPGNGQIEEAKAFLRLRLEAEVSARDNIEEYMAEAAEEIVAISQKYRISPRLFRFSANGDLRREVDEVIRKLKGRVVSATETLAVYDREEDKDAILSYLNGDKYGKTFKERLSEYANRYKFELEAAIAAGLYLGKTGTDVLDAVRRNLNAPYNNPDIKASFGKGLSATRIETRGIRYGAGHSNSAFNMITSLSRNEIGQAWMWWYGEQAVSEGAVGFYSYRGSSYPCGHCDSMVGYHPIADYRCQWHPNCRCYFVFV